MEIKASDIKALRDKTQAGMMDCKKALIEASGNFANAEKLLREWGMAGIEKRSGRPANEGRIFFKDENNAIAMIELSCETDFVAKNKDFIEVGEKIVTIVYNKKYNKIEVELEDILNNLATAVRENIGIKKVAYLYAKENEYLHSYTHGEGNLGVVVRFKAENPRAFSIPEVKSFIHDIALHIAAFNPMFLDNTKPDKSWIKEQEEIFKKQIESDKKMQGKDEKIINGIMTGKIKKLFSEICLLEQGFIRDEKKSVSQALSDLIKSSGSGSLKIEDYLRVKVGEA